MHACTGKGVRGRGSMLAGMGEGMGGRDRELEGAAAFAPVWERYCEAGRESWRARQHTHRNVGGQGSMRTGMGEGVGGRKVACMQGKRRGEVMHAFTDGRRGRERRGRKSKIGQVGGEVGGKDAYMLIIIRTKKIEKRSMPGRHGSGLKASKARKRNARTHNSTKWMEDERRS